jgi:hypothetical protein
MHFLLTNAVAALIPLLIGFAWYNPKVFGKAWMASAGMTEDSMKGANMALVFGLTYLFSFFLATELNFITIHQFGLFSMFQDPAGKAALADPNSELGKTVHGLLTTYQNNFRTYKHGALHGFIAGVTFALPIVGVNALFERKGFKYIAINAGFWIVCCVLMGAIVCHWQVRAF